MSYALKYYADFDVTKYAENSRVHVGNMMANSVNRLHTRLLNSGGRVNVCIR